MDLREHLRSALQADPPAADLDAALATLPPHVEVRRADGGRRLLMFTDDTPVGADAPAWFRQCTGTVVAPTAPTEGTEGGGCAIVGYAGERSLDVAPGDLDAELDAEGAEWYSYVEGVRMILYRWKDEWCLSTARVIDARTSTYFRGSRTFGEQFDAAAAASGLDLAALDPGRCYVFVVQTPDTPMVNPCAAHALLHVATVDLATLEQVPGDDVGVPRPAWRPAGPDWSEVRRALDGPLAPTRLGVIARGRGRWHAKIMHPDYVAARELVGGDRNLGKRMLEIASTPSLKAVLLQLMPEKREEMLAADAAIDAATRLLHRLYVEFNVRHRRTPQPQPVYESLKALQKEYLARPEPRRRMCFGDVDAFARRLPPAQLTSLVRACANNAA